MIIWNDNPNNPKPSTVKYFVEFAIDAIPATRTQYTCSDKSTMTTVCLLGLRTYHSHSALSFHIKKSIRIHQLRQSIHLTFIFGVVFDIVCFRSCVIHILLAASSNSGAAAALPLPYVHWIMPSLMANRSTRLYEFTFLPPHLIRFVPFRLNVFCVLKAPSLSLSSTHTHSNCIAFTCSSQKHHILLSFCTDIENDDDDFAPSSSPVLVSRKTIRYRSLPWFVYIFHFMMMMTMNHNRAGSAFAHSRCVCSVCCCVNRKVCFL